MRARSSRIGLHVLRTAHRVLRTKLPLHLPHLADGEDPRVDAPEILCVAGTDKECGKTALAEAVLRALRARGIACAGAKVADTRRATTTRRCGMRMTER